MDTKGRHCEEVLLCGSANPFGVIPWRDHGIQKIIKILILIGSRGQAYSTGHLFKKSRCHPRESGDPY
ncbi:MAG TPA: hypothetical protein LFV92_00960 [Rickettsia endosymbiont of Ceroptres masudai]|nr:hypothetical protein [Rickettsia endosymbiont of Ceroptres masudai]